MDNGFILLSRGILESDVFASQKLLKIWVWCLCKANFKDKSVPLKIGKGETVVKVKRGSFIFGRNKAEEELFIDGSTIYKSMQKLKELEMIEIESNNQFSIITISNYNAYQDIENYKVTTKEQPSNNQVTSKEQASNTTKNYNNANKDKKVNNKLIINSFLLSEIKISNDTKFFEFGNNKIETTEKEIINFKTAVWFQKLFIKNLKEKNAPFANQEKATYKNYVNPIRLMFENDNVTQEQVKQSYDFLNSLEGEFWKKQILSTSKLREKIPQLLIQKNTPNGKQQFTSSTKKPARFSVARATETLRADAERKQREMENRNT